jgi:hypothetical protein
LAHASITAPSKTPARESNGKRHTISLDFAAIRAGVEVLRHADAQVHGPTTLPPAGASETLLHKVA